MVLSSSKKGNNFVVFGEKLPFFRKKRSKSFIFFSLCFFLTFFLPNQCNEVTGFKTFFIFNRKPIMANLKEDECDDAPLGCGWRQIKLTRS
jgi:hypothetical protein